MLYIAMELVPGTTLASALREFKKAKTSFSVEALVAVAIQTCNALEAVHSARGADGEVGLCTVWDGVRYYQARNSMRDDMKVGDQVLLYHSSTEDTGVVGLGRVSKTAVVDALQCDQRSA